MTQNHPDVVASDAQIVKLGSVRDNMAFWVLWVVRRSEARDDALGRHDVQNVQVFDDACGVSLEGFVINSPAGHMCVS
jgi:hypothetical protein